MRQDINFNWPMEQPFPFLWKQYLKDRLLDVFDPDYVTTIANTREAYIKLGMGFEPGDESEILIDWLMFYKNPRVFIFSDLLTKELAETDVNKIPNELVRLPFESIYVDFSDADINVVSPNSDLKKNLRGILLYETREEGGERYLFANAIHHTPGNKGFRDHKYPFSYIFSGQPLADGEFQNKVDQEEVETARQKIYLRDKQHHETGLFTNFDDKRTFNATLYHTNLIRALTINSVLYINSANRDMEEEWFKKNLNEKIKKATGKRKTKLKQNRKSHGHVYRAGYYLSIPTMPTYPTGEKTDRKIGVRFKCRGHWRHCWTGPRRGERKKEIRWIRPHWKGPEFADRISEKIFKVNKKEVENAEC